ncbi:MAG: PEP-CTERM sorting domain-containing protein [Burkholderiales bacterium PBB2]|nr:MAG: PEP-CTERM sorting domain-containing protein [Burkholderiales bacterium PBB2]
MNTKTFARAPGALNTLVLALTLAAAATSAQAQSNTLVGWAKMPANTFSDGPTSGQFASGAGGNPLPLLNKQPVQGFSAVLNGPSAGSYLFMPDNGFGTQGNSGDTLLRMYAVTPDFKTALGGSGTVSAANYQTGASLPAFNADSRITLADPDRKLGFKIQADYTNYYNNAANPLVDASIRSGRLLTGADFDIESVRKDKNGNLWFGEEFGPFLVKADASGKVLRTEVGLPGVMSPQNPYLNGGVANLPGSGGFEGMAINPAGDKLYTLLEKSVTGDAAGTLRINEFSIDSESYTGTSFRYKLDAAGTNIGDMTALNDHELIIIERNNATATGGGTPFKKLFRIDLNRVDAQGYVSKTELVDLMNIADPNDLNGDGSTTFTFPFVTIESVLVLDENTLLIANDNNYPGTGGRDLGSDNTEFLKIQLANPVPEPSSYAMLLGGLGLMGAWLRRRKTA